MFYLSDRVQPSECHPVRLAIAVAGNTLLDLPLDLVFNFTKSHDMEARLGVETVREVGLVVMWMTIMADIMMHSNFELVVNLLNPHCIAVVVIAAVGL